MQKLGNKVQIIWQHKIENKYNTESTTKQQHFWHLLQQKKVLWLVRITYLIYLHCMYMYVRTSYFMTWWHRYTYARG